MAGYQDGHGRIEEVADRDKGKDVDFMESMGVRLLRVLDFI